MFFNFQFLINILICILSTLFFTRNVKNFLKETFIIQNQLGVDASFDFITGREFTMQKVNKIAPKATENTDKTPQDVNKIEEKVEKTPENIVKNQENVVKPVVNINLDNVKTFEELCEEIKNFNGCDLKRHCTNSVIFDGNKDAKIMIIGEAPGETEDLEGKPFCGKSGQLLRKALSFIDITTANSLISNVVFWRPPMNRTPNDDEVKLCLPFVKKMLEIVKPNVVLLCGSTSTNALLNNKQPISKIVGSTHQIDIDNNTKTTAIPLYHPSYLLRVPSIKKDFWKHLLNVKQLLIEKHLV